ncbi:antibiotic ABC transporter permease [Natrarchaeobius chitinivorans]|uniref:Antibiotic ABC transporter permease n=1 Tax=Natrarchaeobius chitinivorans TaxID=1679083 RepID=A0A3N6MQ32_NATCH|nr:antibiotic ABC transporter permease [Natrarchaeobius chitinivorans]
MGLCRETLAYASERDYTGWDYADGLSSAFVRRLPVEHKYLNLAVQESVKRAPVNLRPLFRVEQRRNYKGAALFALANLEIHALTGEDRYAREARALLEWLLEDANDWCTGFGGGGHRHPLQSLSSETASTPGDVSGVVSTAYAVRALLRGADLLSVPKYDTVARTASEFVFEDLEYTEIAEGARINYTVSRDGSAGGGDSYTLNANAIGARLLLDLFDRFGDDRFREAATAILDYVASKQTALGGWMYTDPPTASHLSMDSFHNGFIVESLLRHREVTGETRYEESLERALEFYRDRLFDGGAPRWDESSTYPRDIHAAAQGIVVFSELGDLEYTRRIVDWTIEALHAGNGRFYYQQRRFYTKRFTLMRWCQGWMAFALSRYLRRRRDLE